MAWDQIGPFSFVKLSRAPALVKQQTVVRARPGVAGVRVQQIGVRGAPFAVESFADALTFAEAQQLATLYAAAPGGDAYSVTYGQINFDSAGHRYFCLDVQIVEIGTLLTTLGGLNTNSQAFIRARWELLPVRAW